MVQPADYKTIGVVKATFGRKSEKQQEKDMEAYKRLRKQGLQPPAIDGCAKLEKEAVTRDEIVTGAVVHGDAKKRKKVAKERRAAFDRAREFTEQ